MLVKINVETKIFPCGATIKFHGVAFAHLSIMMTKAGVAKGCRSLITSCLFKKALLLIEIKCHLNLYVLCDLVVQSFLMVQMV